MLPSLWLLLPVDNMCDSSLDSGDSEHVPSMEGVVVRRGGGREGQRYQFETDCLRMIRCHICFRVRRWRRLNASMIYHASASVTRISGLAYERDDRVGTGTVAAHCHPTDGIHIRLPDPVPYGLLEERDTVRVRERAY
jgi:hypothetical protein